ncbi:MAG: ATP phosphoribosyltransferase [Caulobacteraceae bacterium]
MSRPLILAAPSKGRLKAQVEDWLADCGLGLSASGGARGYLARLEGFDGAEVRLASAADIAASLALGDIHLGITGEDLLGEASAAGAAARLPLRSLGFGRADLVVAAPRSWLDVETMADVDEVAHRYMARTGARLRVATKYVAQTRAFFARHAIADYRVVESGGATEGAPAAGLAELIVDITTTGATLADNGLRPLADGLILRSQAQLVASLAASWDEAQIAACARLLAIIEARARGRTLASLVWPASQDMAARAAIERFTGPADSARANGLLIARCDLFAATQTLAAAGVGPVSVTQPAYVFEAGSEAFDRLAAALGRSELQA